MKDFDVIIAGAGPAGSATALKLASSGLRVGLFDKAKFPRDKTCGDALSLDVINQLAMLSPGLMERFGTFAQKLPSWGVTIYSPAHHKIEIPFIHKGQKSFGYTSPRLHFDELLFREVQQHPHIKVFEDCKLTAVKATDQEVVINTSRGHFSAEMIVGADGAHSVVGKQLGGITVDPKHYSAGLRVYYENVGGFHAENNIELHFFRNILPGYLWVFPLAGNKANVGIGVLSSAVAAQKMNLRETLDELLKTHPGLKDRFRDARPLESVKGFGLPLGSKKRNISGHRFLLTGDAASLIDPFSGEGIGNAIRSGRVAAEHIEKCFAARNFTARFNNAYDKEIYRRMWNEFRISHTLQKAVQYPRLFDFVVRKATTNKHLQYFITEALADVEKKKKVLYNPMFYYRVLFGG